MANSVYYSNTAQATTLSGSISAGATSITVGAVTGFPGSFPYILAVDFEGVAEELVKVTAAGGTTLTVERGYGGTSAQSHSLGAVVRHVYNAQDATDFRTHEAASAAVHGLTGTVVGTSDSQTLTNKTINGAALSGTFTGTPTFSGAVTLSGGGTLGGTFAGAHTYSGAVTMSGGGTLSGTFTGAPTLSGAVAFTGAPVFSGGPVLSRAGSTDLGLSAKVSGDTNDRLQIEAGGTLRWGSGGASTDALLKRAGAAILQTDSTVQVAPGNTGVDAFYANLPSGTSGALLNLNVNSAAKAAMDANGVFTTYAGNSFTTFTPTVANGGSVTWSNRSGWYMKVGKMVFVNMYFVVDVAGSGGSNFQISTPTDPSRATRQTLVAHCEGLSASYNGTNSLVAFTSGSGAVWDRLRAFDGTNITGAQLAAGGIIAIQGWYREA